MMAGLKTPSVAIVIGEGGSGGALAIGVADRLIMLENTDLLGGFARRHRRHPVEGRRARRRMRPPR